MRQHGHARPNTVFGCLAESAYCGRGRTRGRIRRIDAAHARVTPIACCRRIACVCHIDVKASDHPVAVSRIAFAYGLDRWGTCEAVREVRVGACCRHIAMLLDSTHSEAAIPASRSSCIFLQHTCFISLLHGSQKTPISGRSGNSRRLIRRLFVLIGQRLNATRRRRYDASQRSQITEPDRSRLEGMFESTP